MQDLSASFPSLKRADTHAMPAAAPAVEHVQRTWQQPLGDVHVRLNSIIGSSPLLLRFDANDADFVFELATRWPISTDYTASTYEADIIKLADALNGLVRQYAIETGSTRMHVLVEARRGQFDIPGWWVGAPCMFATYAMDTSFAEVGLFTNITDAYTQMDMLTQPHRMLIAIGPATPEMVEGVDGAWVDPDEERLRSLKRWSQQMTLQVNTLIADMFSGGEDAVEAVMDALSRIRDVTARLSTQILRLEKRTYRPKPENQLEAELMDMPLPTSRRAGKLDMAEDYGHAGELSETLIDLRDAIKDAHGKTALPEVRRELQNGLRALNTLEASMGTAAPAPTRQNKKQNIVVKCPRNMAGRVARKTGEFVQRKAAFGALAAVRKLKRVKAKWQKKPKAPVADIVAPAPQQQKKKFSAPGLGPNI